MKILKKMLYFTFMLFENKRNGGGKTVQSKKLQYVDCVTTEPQHNLNFLEFFQDKEWLLVWGALMVNIRQYGADIVDQMPITAWYFDWKNDMSDAEISHKLSVDYTFDFIKGLALVLWLLTKQWDGKHGALLTNGRANVFHIKIFLRTLSLHLNFDVEDYVWNINDWTFGSTGHGSAGNRIFSSKPPRGE